MNTATRGKNRTTARLCRCRAISSGRPAPRLKDRGGSAAGGFEARPLTRPTVALEHHTSVVFVSSVLRSHVKAFPRSAALPRNLRPPHEVRGRSPSFVPFLSCVHCRISAASLVSPSPPLSQRLQPRAAGGKAAASHTPRAARCAVHRLHTHALSPRARASSCAPRGAVLTQGGVFVVFRAACSRVSACNRRLRSLPRACCIRKPPRGAHPIPSLNGFLQP
jgi:hypothetical protein